MGRYASFSSLFILRESAFVEHVLMQGPQPTHRSAQIPDGRRKAVLAELAQPAPQGVNVDRYEEEFEQIRREGVAYSIEEVFPGMCSVASPVGNADEPVMASIAIVVPAERFGPVELRRHAQAVRRAAAAISTEAVLNGAL